MLWAKIQVITTNEAIEAVSVILEKFGGKGVEIDDQTSSNLQSIKENVNNIAPNACSVTTWIPENPDLDIEKIKYEINNLTQYGLNPGKVKIYLSLEDDVDWNQEWKKHYSPINVTHDLVIIPSWQKEKYQKDPRIKIYINPGMAFGTGDHPTTILTLQALLMTFQKGDQVFDIGSGSGILSIAAAKIGAREVQASDVDESTLENAEENLRLNQVEGEVVLSIGDLLNNQKQKADLIVANILAEVHFKLIPQLKAHLNPQGRVILGGIINDKLASVIEILQDNNFVVKEKLMMKEWVTLIVESVS